MVVKRKKEKHRKKENTIKDASQIKSADPANLKKRNLEADVAVKLLP